MIHPTKTLTTLGLLAAAMTQLQAQHSHVNAGAMGSVVGGQLYFANGDSFITNSGYVVNLAWAETAPFAGWHLGSITFTALAASTDFGGPAFGHAATGAHLELRVESVAGPAGGEFAFWESDGESDATEIAFRVPVGEAAGTNRFRLSETDGSPGVDPYGHIHGRKFTASLPGLYTVGFRIFDTSVNGPGGGPLHPPSELFPLHFQAGITIAGLAQEAGGMKLTFATQTGRTYFLERTTSLSPPDWQTIAGPFAGNNHLQTVTDPPGTTDAAWFRLRVE